MYPILPEGEFVLLFSFDDEHENLRLSKYIYILKTYTYIFKMN